MIDSLVLRAHQHGAGAQKKPARPGDRPITRGLSTKIHALVDALGNPVNFFLTGGEAHDLVGADHPPAPSMQTDTLIADKAFPRCRRAGHRAAGCGKRAAVIPPKSKPTLPRRLRPIHHQARHLIESFFPAKL